MGPATQQLGLDIDLQYLAMQASGPVTGWVYAGENPILRFEGAPGSEVVSYYLEDASDSIRAVLPASGGTPEHYDYDAFGNLLDGSGTPTSAAGGDFGYHGAWRDTETGLYHMRARTYDPVTGRFTTPDPAEPSAQAPETFEPYSFANNNPHLYSDPTGLFSITEINVGSAISSTIRNGRAAAVHQAKRYAIDKAQELAIDFLAEALTGFLPGMSLLAGVEKFTRGFDQGRAFDSLVKGEIAEAFNDLPFAQNLWFDAQVSSRNTGDLRRGEAATDGFNATREGVKELKATKFGRTYPRPDFIYREGLPTDPDVKSWLIGDFKLSINAIHQSIVQDRSNQWKSIAAHAAHFSHGRVTLYVALRGHKNETVQNAQVARITKAAIGKGVIMLIANILD